MNENFRFMRVLVYRRGTNDLLADIDTTVGVNPTVDEMAQAARKRVESWAERVEHSIDNVWWDISLWDGVYGPDGWEIRSEE